MSNDISCPQCGSTQLHSCKRGYSVKKGALGWLFTGGIGLVGGLIGANKIVLTCLECGYNFEPSKSNVVAVKDERSLSNSKSGEIQSEIIKEESSAIKNIKIKKKKVVCSNCGSQNEMEFRYCRACGWRLDISKMKIINNGQDFEYIKCPYCFKSTTKPSRKNKYCTSCGSMVR